MGSGSTSGDASGRGLFVVVVFCLVAARPLARRRLLPSGRGPGGVGGGHGRLCRPPAVQVGVGVVMVVVVEGGVIVVVIVVVQVSVVACVIPNGGL